MNPAIPHRVRHGSSPTPAPWRTRGRVVVISNRLPAIFDRHRAGGLVSAILPGFEGHRGAWIGWSGRVRPYPTTSAVVEDEVRYVGIDLTPEEHADYYEAYANGTLWPLMHGLPERAHVDPRDYPAYRRVVRRIAERAMDELSAGDLVWVHDYHLLPLGQEVRRLGWGGALGYFHHVPVPPRDAWRVIPGGDALAEALRAYDRIGVQTAGDARRLAALLGTADARRVGVYPVAVDVPALRAIARSEPAPHRIYPERALLFAVDRLDYTKGIPQRLAAFEALLEQRPDLRGRVFLLQWAVISRAALSEYQRERADVERLASHINERWSTEHVRVSLEHHPHAAVIAQLRASETCVATPVRDGMNLVAKEYVAVHDAAHPGALVLSSTCGAADELREAILVDPLDRDAFRQGLERAIDMELAERRRRSASLHERLAGQSPRRWFDAFIDDLHHSWRSGGRHAPAGTGTPAPR